MRPLKRIPPSMNPKVAESRQLTGRKILGCMQFQPSTNPKTA